MSKKRGLGKSLEALLTKTANPDQSNLASGGDATHGERLTHLALDQIQSGKYQPRRDIDLETLQELAESIRSQGLIQPIVVRPLEGQDKYEIIAGERRWRASGLAGLSQIPAIIRHIPDEAAIAMALIENIQRENLNPIDEAVALQKLIDEFEMTHQQIAEAVGKSRAAITNSLRLLALNEEVKIMVEKGQLEMGHARALLSLPQKKQIEAATIIVQQGLSVRQAEKLAQHFQNPESQELRKKPMDPDLKRLQENLSQRLGMRVSINSQMSGRGKIIIHYRNLTEFDKILAKLPEGK